MDHQQLKAIIDRYLQGQATAAEEAFIEQWLSEGGHEPVEFTDTEWARLRTDMLSGIRQEAGYETPGFPQKEGMIRRLLPVLRRVAAVLLLAAGAYGLFWYLRSLSVTPPVKVMAVKAPAAPQYRIVATGKKEIRRIVLPDSSVVMLNRASRLRFPAQFGDSGRNVHLEEGEAFFDVRKDAAQPFIVHTKKIKTRVLGTSFNIRAYGGTGKVSVMVSTGRVKVTAPATAANWSDGNETILQRDHGVEIDTIAYKGRTFAQPAQIATAWCAPLLVFNQHTLQEITMALEKKFGVDIRITSPALKQCRYTATFPAGNTLTDILDALCLVHQLQYVRKGNRIEISGEECK